MECGDGFFSVFQFIPRLFLAGFHKSFLLLIGRLLMDISTETKDARAASKIIS